MREGRLGTGVETALAQIVAEELDVPFHRIQMIMGDTAKTVDQGRTTGSGTVESAGAQLRQAAAAGRLQLLKLGSARLQTSVDKLSVNDGVVEIVGEPSKNIVRGTHRGQVLSDTNHCHRSAA